ncbi:MAG: hypothetical protein VX699_13510 [Myxococcota bacterium]|nr:hypothetical protein [Myxococcota bacterium]
MLRSLVCRMRLFGRKIGWLVVVGLLLVGAPSVGTAAEDVVYEKHTIVDFGDDTIEGDLTKPDGQYLESRKRLRHERLIKIRDSFRHEILRSVRIL